ncbi:unnamed protein product [marine sediment metagenome]|uniref:Uncharacterized protein n=1 Tax=marine sediment metagenome TaxID=412755 RepID=X1MBQ3_9ZZZZ
MKIEIEDPHTGKPTTIEIKDDEWMKYSNELDITIKATVVCTTYIMTFMKEKKTGNVEMVYCEETKTD